MTFEAMSCEQVEGHLADYLADGLSPDEESRLARHLTSCDACAAEAALAERVEVELAALPAFDAPPELIARIKAVAEPATVAPEAWRARRPTFRPRLAMAAGLLLALAIGWLGFERLERSDDGFSAAEVVAAEQEARYALAIVARLSRRASVEIRREVLDEVLNEVLVERVARPVLRGVSRPLASSAVKDGGSSS